MTPKKIHTNRRRPIRGVKPQFQGLHPYRYKDNPLEKAFAEAWQAENQIMPGRPTSTLAYLMDLTNRGEPNPPLTDRDHLVAATVIQWLGSPVGQGFLLGRLMDPAASYLVERLFPRVKK